MGPRTVTVDQIAAAAGVGKQTIYRWWPPKPAVVMDPLIELTDPDPVDLPGSTYEAVRLQMRRVARMFASRNGDLIRELVADAQGDPDLPRLPRPFLCPPKGQRGGHPGPRSHHGRAAANLDIDDALDVLYGLLWLRLLIGHRPMTPAAVDKLLGSRGQR